MRSEFKSPENEALFEEIRKYTMTVVSDKRYAHSMRTAQTLADLCKNYGLDEEKGWIAGIAHDMCKDCSDEELFALVKKDGKPVSALEESKPALLHGRAAAILIQEKFGVKDSEIIDAIANHTFGSVDSCDLALLLFVADKIEPGRPQSTDEYRANLFAKSCHGIVLAVLDENIEYLTSRGKSVASPSLELAEKLRKELVS
ncbi:bis(5'-nucleosyl)-tetraphosphatase (symmetrical) YqeK [uncultured Treponema sp.]|uniref:bis(5'-nucleosyl)-tetraphosphatase (symmetrical) YqeK n=1 Tax=uncultured Treponema sp. TaxID=162155 RepID=UPI0025F07EC0|nr:bis(5'-nucleosyl)-tetraphosphatase (symmetrical) YqeK [uncultured Treponema sp.]